MKKLKTLIFILTLIALGSILLMPATEARSYRTKASDVYVSGYYRKNGTYVKPYYRTRTDNSKLNNYVCIDYGRCY